MTEETYQRQLKRLKNHWPASTYFKGEFESLLWNAVKRFPDHLFERAVSQLIFNRRVPPVGEDIVKALHTADADDRLERQTLSRVAGSGKEGSFLSVLESAANIASEESRELARRAVQLISDYAPRYGEKPKINKKQFDEGCSLLEEAGRIIAQAKGQKLCSRACQEGLLLIQRPDGRFSYRCTCPLGSKLPQSFVMNAGTKFEKTVPFPVAPLNIEN